MKKNKKYRIAVQGHFLASMGDHFFRKKVCEYVDFCEQNFGSEQTEDVPGIESYSPGSWQTYQYANYPWTFAFDSKKDAMLFKLRFADKIIARKRLR